MVPKRGDLLRRPNREVGGVSAIGTSEGGLAAFCKQVLGQPFHAVRHARGRLPTDYSLDPICKT